MTAALLDFCRLFAGFSSDPCWFFAGDVLQTCLEIAAFLLGCMAYGASMKHAERRHAPSGQFALADQGHFAPCIIAGRTAINFWLHSDKRIEPLSKSACNKLIRAATPSLFTDDMSETLFGEPPFEILVADASSRRNRRKVRCLTSSCGLPSRSLAIHDASTAICTPAFAFCQVNRKLPLIKSIELGTDLCASYWLDMFGDVQQRQYRLATKSVLTRFTESNTALYGSRQAREALRWVRDGSASPMETKLMLLLSLPQRLGGYGFSGARFNYQVNPGNTRSRINQSFSESTSHFQMPKSASSMTVRPSIGISAKTAGGSTRSNPSAGRFSPWTSNNFSIRSQWRGPPSRSQSSWVRASACEAIGTGGIPSLDGSCFFDSLLFSATRGC